MKERRKHVRLPLEIDIEATIPESGETIKGKSVDVSFGGVLVRFSDFKDINIGENCTIKMILSQGEIKNIQMEFECRVMHEGGGELGLRFLQFLTIDLESYNHFKNLMVLNSPDPKTTLEELDKDPAVLLNKTLADYLKGNNN